MRNEYEEKKAKDGINNDSGSWKHKMDSYDAARACEITKEIQ
ncbi:hypothetical protein APP_24020 [Aeribacillus pallidus]|nr:hypothetical protein APP_24020 [Aeribacillus pallidus]